MLSTILHWHYSPVDSTCLKERKTHYGNGITLKPALVGGRYDEQATRPQALESRIAEEANANRKAVGYADVGTMTEKKEEPTDERYEGTQDQVTT
jgi:hypothetical protein